MLATVDSKPPIKDLPSSQSFSLLHAQIRRLGESTRETSVVIDNSRVVLRTGVTILRILQYSWTRRLVKVAG